MVFVVMANRTFPYSQRLCNLFRYTNKRLTHSCLVLYPSQLNEVKNTIIILLKNCIAQFVTQSEKTSLTNRKYTCICIYNMVSISLCVLYKISEKFYIYDKIVSYWSKFTWCKTGIRRLGYIFLMR